MFRYKIFFGIHYQAKYEEFLVVVGNTLDLGNWDPMRGIRLAWTKGNIWKVGITFCHDCNKLCEYKYVLCKQKANSEELDVIRWEEGPNRIITFPNIRKLVFNIQDVWGFRKLSIRIKNNLDNELEILKIRKDLATSETCEMKLKYKKCLFSEVKEQFWQYDFFVKPEDKSFSYSLCVYKKLEEKYSYERRLLRTVYFNFNPSALISYENSLSPNKKRVFLSKGILHNNSIKIFDAMFENSFSLNEIEENIYVGTCLQKKEEIHLIKEKGIKAVLNLQRDRDMKKAKIDLELIKKEYQESNIQFINYQIMDQSPDKIAVNIIRAAQILNEMMQKYEKVYVHCTAGKIRSPYTVMVYLCLYKGVSVREAIKNMKIKRPMALVYKEMLEKIIQFHQKQISLARLSK